MILQKRSKSFLFDIMPDMRTLPATIFAPAHTCIVRLPLGKVRLTISIGELEVETELPSKKISQVMKLKEEFDASDYDVGGGYEDINDLLPEIAHKRFNLPLSHILIGLLAAACDRRSVKPLFDKLFLNSLLKIVILARSCKSKSTACWKSERPR